MTVEMIFFLKFLHVNGRFFDLRIVIGVQSGIAGFSQLFLCISSVVRDLSRSKPVGNVHELCWEEEQILAEDGECELPKAEDFAS